MGQEVNLEISAELNTVFFSLSLSQTHTQLK